MDFYLVIVVMLFVLAVFDLFVGVSNDAVNFLNASIGSRAGSLRAVLIFASVGVLLGALSSSGMMEVARKGIFHPTMFSFNEIMIVFLAVMLTDVWLLDRFNSMGLPTSTTVSIVFELLGGAFAIALIKINNLISSEGVSSYSWQDYINVGKSVTIIGGIFFAILVAFITGAFFQFIARIVFTFDLGKSVKKFGGVFGGFTLTVIAYFIVMKGAKNASFMQGIQSALQDNTVLSYCLVFCFMGFTLLSQLLILLRLPLLKILVLIGTTALAMAFAGNDLVNFIGVAIAGLDSFNLFGGDPLIQMDGLQKKLPAQNWILLLAGGIMIVSMFVSKRARNVVKTSIDLSKKDSDEERFGASIVGRFVVRNIIHLGQRLSRVIPSHVATYVEGRFKEPTEQPTKKVAFDMVRATVILVASSIVITYGTINKLPLSTTYVTFMVAMGASFSDRAWGRDSAVFRVTGVFTVILGWLLTAFVAFSVAFFMANILYFPFHWGTSSILQNISHGIALLIFAYVTYNFLSNNLCKKKDEETEDEDEELSIDQIVGKTIKNELKLLDTLEEAYSLAIDSLESDDRKTAKAAVKKADSTRIHTKGLRKNSLEVLRNLENYPKISVPYVQTGDYLRELSRDIYYTVQNVYTHIENKHTPMIAIQKEELRDLEHSLKQYIKEASIIIEERKIDDVDDVEAKMETFLHQIEELSKNQIRRSKNKETNTRSSLLFLDVMSGTKMIVIHIFSLLKRQKSLSMTLV